MAGAKSVAVTVIDMGTGRSAVVKAGIDTSVRDIIAKGYEGMGEPSHKSDRYFDDRGNALDDDLDNPVAALLRHHGGTATVEIRHPTGGGVGYLRRRGALTRPAKNDPDAARSQLREDIEVVRSNPLAQKRGWKLVPDYDRLRLWADMWALDEDGGRLDGYHVDMDMQYYRKYPLGVTFVNPKTRSFDQDLT